MQDLRIQRVDGLAVAVARAPKNLRDRWQVPFTDVESLIDAVRTVEGIDVAVVLKEDDQGRWRVSTRSLGRADVGAACTRVGGGGHRLAAGFTGSANADDTLADFLQALAA